MSKPYGELWKNESLQKRLEVLSCPRATLNIVDTVSNSMGQEVGSVILRATLKKVKRYCRYYTIYAGGAV